MTSVKQQIFGKHWLQHMIEQTQYMEYLLENCIYLMPSYRITNVGKPSRGSELRYDAFHSRNINLKEREHFMCQRKLICGNSYIKHGHSKMGYYSNK